MNCLLFKCRIKDYTNGAYTVRLSMSTHAIVYRSKICDCAQASDNRKNAVRMNIDGIVNNS